jgi:hypothetical protein
VRLSLKTKQNKNSAFVSHCVTFRPAALGFGHFGKGSAWKVSTLKDTMAWLGEDDDGKCCF